MNADNIAKYDLTTVHEELIKNKQICEMVLKALPDIMENNSENEIALFTVELLKLRETELIQEFNNKAHDPNFLGNLLDCDTLANILQDYELLKYYLSLVPDDYVWESATDLIDRSLDGADLHHHKLVFENIIKTEEHQLISYIVDYWETEKSKWTDVADPYFKAVSNLVDEAHKLL